MIGDAVILKEQPDVESFKQFVKELGGRWTVQKTSGCRTEKDHTSKKIIHIDVRRNEKSSALAKEIEDKIAAKWGGYIYKE